jgi:hypothetical protein
VRATVRWTIAFRRAGLSLTQSAKIGTRSLDLLHVATAKAVGAVESISFDARQRSLALAAGFKVAP